VLARSLERVDQIGRELHDPLITALPRSLIGLFEVFSGRLREGVATLEEAQPLLAQKRDFVGSTFALMALGIDYARLGEFDKAERAVAYARELGEQGDVVVRIDGMIGESSVRSIRGDLDAAVALATQCTQMAERAGASACVVASNFVLGDAQFRQGQFGAAKIAFDRGDEIVQVTEQRMFRPSIAAYLRSINANMGQVGTGGQTFEEALADARAIDDLWAEATITLKRAETELTKSAAERDQVQLLADYAIAAQSFADMGARPFHARVMRDWGHALLAIGRADEGREKLRAARDELAALGIAREADELGRELGE
jgi:tetratricopeptide (TPR) repeat protein